MNQQPTETERLEAVRQELAAAIAKWVGCATEPYVTPIQRLTLYQMKMPSEPIRCIFEPGIALIVQGSKRVLLGEETISYHAGQLLVTAVNVPTIANVTSASADRPYQALWIPIDLQAMAALMMEGNLPPPRSQPTSRGIAVGQANVAILKSFLRLIELLDEPETIPVLSPLVLREILYRLLMSDYGAHLWQIATVGSQSHRIVHAIDWLQANFSRTLRVEELAASVQMSSSTFHHHFRALTAMSPLQYQKKLRLHEARRLMLSDGLDAATTAFRVGYESASQFGREYHRMFGAPPARDIMGLRQAMVADVSVDGDVQRMKKLSA
ncbi:AraC family transcriptional regulator [Crenobacter sp. SG2305]|uniref:AraC family transcriptional regulator n=1 Tax=Crenobacter oryzisoli TaxID=3056844 RepID=UPI0025AB2CE9|nr:AraC family transcriptional regulator [Crenobacter sp. SG2305]MDN0085234.1 AraC family transcriptional regulator [Crenobacter sp. SG2305]